LSACSQHVCVPSAQLEGLSETCSNVTHHAQRRIGAKCEGFQMGVQEHYSVQRVGVSPARERESERASECERESMCNIRCTWKVVPERWSPAMCMRESERGRERESCMRWSVLDGERELYERAV